MKRLLAGLALLLATPALAEPPDRSCTSGKWGQVQCIRTEHFVFDTCQLLELASTTHGLDSGFFTRLIWQESRFDPHALSHANARGIAQFIPSTAALRGLEDPFNPADALDHSARYLAEMTEKYGNIGLAAVGYNGGEKRAEGLIAGTGGLAQETIDYVQIITGLSAENWRDDPPETLDLRLSRTAPFRTACYDLARDRKLSPMPRAAPRVKPWGVQLAFGTSRASALAKFKAATATCNGKIKGETPDLIHQKARGSGKGGYYMARIGRDTAKQADKLCLALARAGCICRVYKN